MKLAEALEEVKKVKPNGFDDDTLTLFVNKLEQNAFETLRTPPWQRKKYKWSEDADVTLVIPPPYDNAYISWLKAQIDYNNEEHASYANNQAQFNLDYEEFEKWVMRSGAATPKPPKKFYFGGRPCPPKPPHPPRPPEECEIDIPPAPGCRPPHLMFDNKDIIEATQAAVAAAGNANEAAVNANAAMDTLSEAAENGDFNGATFVPEVDKEGNISWTNDREMPNPPTTNIRGPQGIQGEPGITTDTYAFDASSGDLMLYTSSETVPGYKMNEKGEIIIVIE